MVDTNEVAMTPATPVAAIRQLADDLAQWPMSYRSDAVDALREYAALREAQETETWQPIETAPKDGTELLGWFPYYARTDRKGCVLVIRWNDDKYHKTPRPFFEASGFVWGVRDNREKQPTHWMPLPAHRVQEKRRDDLL